MVVTPCDLGTSTPEYIKVWGSNVHHEMETGKVTDFLSLWKWLLKEEQAQPSYGSSNEPIG